MKREWIRDVVRIDGALVARLDEQTFVSVSLPDGVSIDEAWEDVQEECELEVDGHDAVCRAACGDVRFRIALQPERVAPGTPWRDATVRGHGPGPVITLDFGRGDEMCALAGDGRTTMDDLLARIEASLPPGSRVRVMRGEHEGIAAITHPDPTIDRMAVAMLRWRGADLATVRRRILESGSVHARVQFSARRGRRDDAADGVFDDGAGGTIGVEMRHGHVVLDIAVGDVCYAQDCLILQGRTLPETAATAAVGRPLSDLVDLPFEHPDPVVARIEDSIGDAYVEWAPDRIRLSEMA